MKTKNLTIAYFIVFILSVNETRIILTLWLRLQTMKQFIFEGISVKKTNTF